MKGNNKMHEALIKSKYAKNGIRKIYFTEALHDPENPLTIFRVGDNSEECYYIPDKKVIKINWDFSLLRNNK